MKNKELEVKLAQLYAAVGSDEALKHRFKTKSVEVLKEFGIEVPAKMSVIVHENTKDSVHLVVPLKADMDSLAGGAVVGGVTAVRF